MTSMESVPTSFDVGIRTFGNRCGHDPLSPRLELMRPIATNVPPVLLAMSERIKKYFYNPSFFPSLNDANGSDRQQRSERREACYLALAAILKYVNIVTLRCEIPTYGGMMAITLDYLASHAGLSLRRMERAVKDLKTAGIIEVKQRSMLKANGFRRIAAIKSISRHVFAICGLLQDLDAQVAKRLKTQDKTAEKARKDDQRQDQADKARQSLRWKSILDKAVKKPSAPKPRPEVDDHLKAAEAEHRHQYNIRCLELKQEHPDWSNEQIRKEAGLSLVGRIRLNL